MIKRRAQTARGEAFQTINITPFTDVLLVLLIIFLIAGSSLAPSGLDVGELSNTEIGGQSQLQSTELALRVSLEGELHYFDGTKVESDKLDSLDKSTVIELTAPPECPMGSMVKQYDRLLRLGFQKVRLASPSSLEL